MDNPLSYTKWTIIVQWRDGSDAFSKTDLSWQEIINQIVRLQGVGQTDMVRSVIVQPTIPVSLANSLTNVDAPQEQTQKRYYTAEELRAA